MVPYSPSLLSLRARGAVLLLVLLLHAGAVFGLTGISFKRIEVPEPPTMEVRMVAPELPPPPAAPEIAIALQEDTPPPEWLPEPQLPEPPPLELAVEPPMPDLPPPVFPVAKLEPKPAPTPRPKPVQPRPVPEQTVQAPPRQIFVEPLAPLALPSAPAEAPPSPRPPAPPSRTPYAIKTVEAAEIRYREPPQPIYPTYALRAREFGTALIGVLIDASGRPPGSVAGAILGLRCARQGGAALRARGAVRSLSRGRRCAPGARRHPDSFHIARE